MAHHAHLLWRRTSFHQQCCSASAPRFLRTSLSPVAPNSNARFELLHFDISPNPPPFSVSFRLIPLRRIRLYAPPPRKDIRPGGNPDVPKSGNQKKREFQVVERFGEVLATFEVARIKKITSVIFENQQVAHITFKATILAKELLLRTDSMVREGRRRHFKYIGGLLSRADPYVLHDLILSTKRGDEEKFKMLCKASKAQVADKSLQEEVYEDENETEIVEDNNEREIVDDNNDNEIVEVNGENEITEDNNVKKVVEDHHAEENQEPSDQVSRWFNGLITDDIDITEEVFGIYDVDFDREELFRLIGKVKSFKDGKPGVAKTKAEKTRARRSLANFLQDIADQMEDS